MQQPELISSLAMRLWAQHGQLVNWEHLGADARGYDKTVTALSNLLELGFDVRLSPAGVRLIQPVDTPCAQDKLPEHIGPCVCFPLTGSTNTMAKNLARAGANHGTLVVAEAQLDGRGRHGHEWFSPAGLGLWFSMILRPNIPVESPGLIPLLIGVTVSRSVASLGATGCMLKWTNDVLFGMRKLAGILVERIESGPRETFVAGIGLNVHHTDSDFPDSIRGKAVALDQILRGSMHRGELLQTLVKDISAAWESSLVSGFRTVPHIWNEESRTIGMPVRAAVDKEILTGTILGVDETGALRLRLPDGFERSIVTGRIELMKDARDYGP